MKYEVLTRECKWMSEPKGGFVTVADGRRYKEHLIEFCDANGLTPVGGISVTSNGGMTVLVSQMCYKPGGTATEQKKRKK